MSTTMRAGLVRNFASLLKHEGNLFQCAVVRDVLKISPLGTFSKPPPFSETDNLHMFHGSSSSSSSEMCSCLFPGVSDDRHISTMTISAFVDHVKQNTETSDGPSRTCKICQRQFLSKSRVFMYDDRLFRNALLSALLQPRDSSLTILDIPKFDVELEETHLLYIYLFAGNTDQVLTEMTSDRVETAWTVVKLNFENMRTLRLTGASQWRTGNLKWPLMYFHIDDTRCTCMATPIESCCTRFDFESNVVVGVAKSQPWNKGLFFISIGRAIHHLTFHTKPESDETKTERHCLLCHQRIFFKDFAPADLEALTKLREMEIHSDPMILDPHEDSEAVVEDRSPKIVSRSDSSPILLKRARSPTVRHLEVTNEPVFKRAKSTVEVDSSVVRPKIARTSKLPKATPEILHAMFFLAFEDDVLRKNLDQWLPWISRSDCQPADRIPNRSWQGLNMSTKLITSDGFARINNATELTSVSIYIPRPTNIELDAEYEKVVRQAESYSFSAKRGTTRIFCRNVQVMFPYNFDFSRVFVSSSQPSRITGMLDKFVRERTGGYRSLLIDASVGAAEIVIEPLVLSKFDDEPDAQTSSGVSNQSSELPRPENQRPLTDISHNIQIIPIQDNAAIFGGVSIAQPSADIVLVTPHPFKICYPTPNMALFTRGKLTANGSVIEQHTGYSIAPESLERLAADLGIVAPSVPRRDVIIPMNPNGSNIETYNRDNEDQIRTHESKMGKHLGHLQNPLRFLPIYSLTQLLYWPPGSGFVLRFDRNTIRNQVRKNMVGVGADGIAKKPEEQVEIQPCPMYKDPKTGSVVVTYDGRWLLQFVPDEHEEGMPVVSYTVSTNRYLWDKDRTPVNSAADFVVAGGPRVSFFNADEELEELRSCIDPTRPVGEQMRNMERIGSNQSSAVVQTPQLKDHYSIVRIYTRTFLMMLDLNFVRHPRGVYPKEMLDTAHLDIYWRATVPRFQLFTETSEIIPDDQMNQAETDMMLACSLEHAGVRLIVKTAGFYTTKQILDAPIFMTKEQQLFSDTGRTLFAEDSPMLLPIFEEYGKVHLACNSLESTSRLDQFEKFQIDRRNMMQMVLSSTIAKRVSQHPTLPFSPISGQAALRYALVAHTSTNVHRHYPWIAGIFPWMTYDLSIPLDAETLRQRYEEEQKKKEESLAPGKKKKGRGGYRNYNLCIFCKMVTVPITSKRKPARHLPQMCPLFFEYSNSERALLEFALMDPKKLNHNFRDKIMYKPEEGTPSVKGYRLNIEVFKNLRSKLRVSFISRLSSLIKCESTHFGVIYAEDIKLKYSTICIPKRLPWVTLLSSFCGDRLIDSILRDGGTPGFPSSKDEIIPLEKEPTSFTPHIAPNSELRKIFFDVHLKLEERLRAQMNSSESSSSSLSSTTID